MPEPVTESSEIDEILLDFFNETYQDVQATNSSTVYTKAGTHAKAKLKDLIARERQKAVEEELKCIDPSSDYICNDLVMSVKDRLKQLAAQSNKGEDND